MTKGNPVIQQTANWTRLVEAAQLLLELGISMGATRPRCELTVKELLKEFSVAKQTAGRSDRYLRQMQVSVHSFLDDECRIEDITTEQLELTLRSMRLAQRTVRGYFLDLRTLLNFAVRRKYLCVNPGAVIDPPPAPSVPPRIHEPKAVRAVLKAALAENPNFCRRLAIRYFGGLRSAEAFRLTEEELKLDQNLIEVTAAKSKTRRRRLVEITPNLRAWLAAGGRLVPERTSGVATRIASKAGVQWLRNVTRHSWCSYHLARFGSAARTALEGGHTESVLFNVYREVVPRQQAEEFFDIYP